MMNVIEWIMVLAPVPIAAGSFIIGYIIGKRDRNVTLEGLGAKEAFAYLLSHELFRHRQDIAHIKADLRTLERQGIVPPDLPLGLWIEVKNEET